MYATYRKIETFDDAPRAGPLDAQVRESHRLDFKENAAPDKTAEHAKDMATFANGFGGVILVGSKVDAGIVSHLGISRVHAARMVEVYEQAAKDLCSPSPVVNAIIVAMPGTSDVLLAVNVDPVIEGPIGAKQGEAWLFPVREGSHTRFLKPTELPVYMNPQIRRVLLLLDRISDQKNPSLKILHQPLPVQAHLHRIGSQPLQEAEATRVTVHLDRNAADFTLKSTATLSVPLTEIEDIWSDSQGTWNVRVAGRIQGGPPSYAAVVR